MRVAVVDIGTNSTRLLVADVEDGRVTAEVERASRVTRLGQGVDASGALAGEAMERVFAVLADYRTRIDELQAEATVAVLTSAVRDAANGPDFADTVSTRFGLDARTIAGEEEARLTFLGATSERPRDGAELAVVDIGGGSTEIVVGHADQVDFFVSMQAGVVRQTERHLAHDPPHPAEISQLRAEVAQTIATQIPEHIRQRVEQVVAVAGTATSAAAIDQELVPYAPEKVHGYRLERATLERQLERLAKLPVAGRREVQGLHPDRAPVIVAGIAMLLEVVDAFGVGSVEASEHDILRGTALELAAIPQDT